MLARISPDFRANVDRSVSIFGDISDELVSRVAKDIIRFRSSGDAPITVLINSNGGLITCADFIHDLLTAPDPNGKRPRIITVAVGNAKSAAANLLALGDYAICYPNAAIHFHGVRFGEVADVTMESASTIAMQLRNRNRITASRLARAGSERLAFHYARMREGFSAIRKESDNPSLSEVECFAHALRAKLSPNGEIT